METPNKILILDDDADWLEVCREFLSQLPSKPEVRTANTGPRALAMLDAEPYKLMICDLKMPRMDGLQVLSIVRRRFPDLRTVVLTGLQDDAFRSRTYALGVDLFWVKFNVQQDSQMFLDCIESLLGRGTGGFRSVQGKSLVDIIEMECVSHSSTVLRITSGKQKARLWIQNGELIDAEAEGKKGEVAFRKILKWETGTFENLPADPDRPRAIIKSVEALVLESAQGVDDVVEDDSAKEAEHRKIIGRLSLLACEGAQSAVSISTAPGQNEVDALAIQNAQPLAAWMRQVEKSSRRLDEQLNVGPLAHARGSNMEQSMVLLPKGDKVFLVVWPSNVAVGGLVEQGKRIANAWDS